MLETLSFGERTLKIPILYNSVQLKRINKVCVKCHALAIIIIIICVKVPARRKVINSRHISSSALHSKQKVDRG